MLKNLSNQKKIWVATAFCFCFMFTESIVGSIYSMLQPYIIKHYGLTLTESTILSLPGQIGHMLIMFIVMLLNGRLDKVKLLFILPFMLGLGALGISTAPALPVLIALMFMNTMLTGYTDNTCTAYVSHMWGSKRGQMIGAMFILFVVGSSVAPTINTISLEKLQWGWNGSYRIVGTIALVFSLLYLLVMLLMKRPELPSIKKVDKDGNVEKVNVFTMLKNRNMKALFMSSITQSFYMYFSSQLPIYFDFTAPEVYVPATVAMIMTANSIGSIISRTMYVPLASKLPAIKYLRIASLASVAFNALGFVANNPYVWAVCMFLSSCISGASFTARTVLTCDEYPENASSASAAASVASGLAGLIATPIMNLVADHVSFLVAMIIPLIFGVGTYFVFRFVYVEHKEEAVEA